MHRAARKTVVLHIAFDVFIKNIAHQLAGGIVDRRDLFQTSFTGENLVGHVQR
ncbi:hypothetical protein D3C85_1664890 [compost metagenome]